MILPRINKEHPGTIAVSIHDSVMTSVMTNDVIKVQKIMKEELTKFIGNVPRLKVENFQKLNSYEKPIKRTGQEIKRRIPAQMETIESE
jgi:hypothetical protein